MANDQDLAKLDGLVIGLDQRGEKSAAQQVRWARTEIERLQNLVNLRTVAEAWGKPEIERLNADLQTMTDSYAEISRVVGRRGTEGHSLADDVRKLCVDIERLKAEWRPEKNSLVEERLLDEAKVKLTGAAAFLDGLASFLQALASREGMLGPKADDCRAMSAKLLGWMDNKKGGEKEATNTT